MTKLIELSKVDEKHWELHLNACLKDSPFLSKEIEVYLMGGELPKIAHPADIHDWLEKPEMREEIEKWLM